MNGCISNLQVQKHFYLWTCDLRKLLVTPKRLITEIAYYHICVCMCVYVHTDSHFPSVVSQNNSILRALYVLV